MAAVTRETTHHRTSSCMVLKWVLTDTDPTGEWVEMPVGADRSVHVIYTSGSGTITIQGTNEAGTPANPQTLRDTGRTAITFIAGGFQQILETSLKVRPTLSGAAGGTSITVLISTVGGD